MGIQIIDNFSISSPKFLDARQSYPTLAALQANTTVKMPKGLEVYVEDTAKWYVMSCTNADDPTTYTWTERPSGGGASLPDQTGHSGDFLTTDGTDASWATAPVTSVNSKTGAVTLTATDVGALSDSTVIPAAQVNSDWNANSGVAEILNKPSLATVATSGSYNDLNNKPTIPTVYNATLTIQKNGTTVKTFTANASTDVTANITVPTDTSDLSNGAGFITGISSGDVTTALGYTPVNPSSLATVATSGSYADLSNKPTIPAAQVNSDWNAVSGVAQILNKPTIPTVNNATLTITQGGVSKGTFTANASSDVTIALDSGGSSLPSQTGNSGKFLTTDGTDASWADINAVLQVTTLQNATATGEEGKIVQYVGTTDTNYTNGYFYKCTKIGDLYYWLEAQVESPELPSQANAAGKVLASNGVNPFWHALSIPTVNNPTITFTQGGVTKGSFTLNQYSAETIALDAGGAGTGTYNYIDADIIGTLTVSSEGDVFGFSTNNYLRCPGVIDLSDADSFELVGSFSKTVGGSANCVLLKDRDKNNITIYGTKDEYNVGRAELHVWHNGTEYSVRGTTLIQDNTRYLVKVTWDGTTYTLYLSTDGTTYTTEGTISLAYPPEPGAFLIKGHQFCTVHMQEYLFKKNGHPFWCGFGPVGLKQRLAIGDAPTGARNVGDIFYTTRNDVGLNGAVECNGGTYSTGDFTGAESIGALLEDGKIPYVSMANYASMVNATGGCDCFGWDGTGNTTFKVPTKTGRFLVRSQKPTSNNDYKWFNVYSDGWVEQGGIQTGVTNPTVLLPVTMSDANYWVDVTGLSEYAGERTIRLYATDVATTQFKIVNTNSANAGGTTQYWEVKGYADLTEYSNKSNWDFQNVKYLRAMVQLAISTTDAAVLTCTNVTAQVGTNTTNIATLQGHALVAFQAPTAQNNYTWYRKYADGWVEQGGQTNSTTDGSVPITLPVEMADANYVPLITGQYITNTGTASNNGASKAAGAFSDRTVTGFNLWKQSAVPYGWEVKGMAA